nr:glycosyltransferase [Clostridium neonatale]
MILMYHKIDIESKTIWWVDVNNFYRQMYELKKKKVVYLDEYDPNDKEQVVITFDGLYKNVLKYAVPILKKFGYPFEVFITSEYLGKNNEFDSVEPYAEFVDEDELKEVIKFGGRIQWHTKTHLSLKNIENEEKIKEELEIPKHLKELDIKSFKWFAYPYGEYNDTVLDYVKKEFVGAVSTNKGNDINKYIYNRITVENKTSFKDWSISLIIPCYNYGRFLDEAVESALNQTILPDEILIVDDCSQDNTKDIGEYYADRYSDLIRFHRNEKNMGIIDNFNNAIKMTTGDFICFLGADNIFEKDYIEKTAQVLVENEEIAIAYTDFALFGDRAKIVYDDFLDERKGKIIDDKYYIINFPEFDPQKLEKGNYIHGSSMYRREAYDQVGGYRSEGVDPEDYNLFYRIIKSGWKAKRVPEPILKYRQHSTEQANIKNITIAQLDFYKKDNKKLKEVLNIKNRDIEELKDCIIHKDKDIKELKEYIAHKDRDIEELKGYIRHCENDIKELKSYIENTGKL